MPIIQDIGESITVNAMTKKAIIFDLDNTIYPVPSIGEQLFASLFQLIHTDGNYQGSFEAIKYDIMRKPFQLVAEQFQLSEPLTQRCLDLLLNLRYEGPIQPYADYHYAQAIQCDKYLVTTGFIKLQQSKIEGMGIAADFKEIHIVDPATSKQTKKDVFGEIVERNGYALADVLVVGDDLQSEIKAAKALGIDTVLYDHDDVQIVESTQARITHFQALVDFL